MGTMGTFLGVKWLEREADHSPPSSAEANEWSYTSTSPIRLHGVSLEAEGQFYLTFVKFRDEIHLYSANG